MNNEDLYKEIRQTDNELMESLIRNYALDVKKIAFLYVNDVMESEDILQEVFIACYQNLHKVREESSYRTWLIRITINKCKDHNKRWSVRNFLYKASIDPQGDFHSAEDSLLTKEKTEETMSHLSHLSSKYKEVLILYYYQELTMEEIGRILSISSNTVKSRLLRAKKKLKEKLEGGN